MSGFFTKNSMVASLFNNTTSSNFGIYNSLSEYNNIRSGNYYKLTKKYYSGDIDNGEVSSKRVNRTEYDYKNGDYKVNLLEKEEKMEQLLKNAAKALKSLPLIASLFAS